MTRRWGVPESTYSYRTPRVSTEWMADAACRGMATALFFPRAEAPSQPDVEAARQACNGCRVREQCLEWAQTTGQRYGIWGGLTVKERSSLKAGRAS